MKHDHNQAHGTEDESDGILFWAVTVNLGLSVFNFIAGLISEGIFRFNLSTKRKGTLDYSWCSMPSYNT